MNNDKSVEAEQIAEGRSREAGVPTVFFGTPSDRGETWIMASSFVGEGVVTFEQVAQDIYDECFDLLVRRQRKYGSRNIDQQGLYGVLVRIRDDKLSRIQRAFNGRLVAGEVVLDEIDTSGEEGDTLEDAYKDVANYAVISLMLLRGLWGKPLDEEVTSNGF